MDVLVVLAGLVGCVPAGLDEATVSGLLSDVGRVRGWLDGVEARLADRLDELRTLPRPPDDTATASTASTDDQIATAQRATSRHASRVRRRGRTLHEVPALGDLLDQGAATGEHLDAIAGALTGLPTALRHQLTTGHGTDIADLARHLDPDQLAREVRHLGDIIAADHGTSRRTRQRQATRLRIWTNRTTQMVHLAGRYDPALGTRLQQRLDHTTHQLFHTTTPDDCPDDPAERHDFLRAHALTHLLFDQPTTRGRRGGGELVVIIDERTLLDGTEHDDTHIDVPGDIDPTEITIDDIRHWARQPDTRIIPARLDPNGIVTHLGHPIPTTNAFHPDPHTHHWHWQPDQTHHSLHQPQPLDHHRNRRVATHAQRIALRIMHPTCGTPDCPTRYEHTTPHHLAWWDRDHGPTNLANLWPQCHRHHHDIHDHHWQITTTPDRRPTLHHPDGHTHHGHPPATYHQQLRQQRTTWRQRRTTRPDNPDDPPP